MKIENTIARIEDGTLPWEEWNHHNHLLLALYYLFTEENEFLALSKIRCALIRYGTLANKTYACNSRYHETITVFWVFAINHFISNHPNKSIEEIETLLSQSELASKEYINKYYPPELLASSEARALYVPPRN